MSDNALLAKYIDTLKLHTDLLESILSLYTPIGKWRILQPKIELDFEVPKYKSTCKP
jgi:hypothetical protein